MKNRGINTSSESNILKELYNGPVILALTQSISQTNIEYTDQSIDV